MAKPGDRVVVEGTKVGGGRREGTLVEMSGSLMRVRWNDGVETYMAPGAGAVRFLPGSGRSASDAKSAKTKVAAKQPKPVAKAKAPAKGKKK